MYPLPQSNANTPSTAFGSNPQSINCSSKLQLVIIAMYALWFFLLRQQARGSGSSQSDYRRPGCLSEHAVLCMIVGSSDLGMLEHSLGGDCTASQNSSSDGMRS